MTIRLLLSVFILQFGYVQAQEKITVEKIWKQYAYFPERAEGYRAMLDGSSYTVRKSDNSIVRRTFESRDNKEELIFGFIRIEFVITVGKSYVWNLKNQFFLIVS